ncbi:MAG: glycerol-3-phosphate acyltransferase [Clostridia bacterium]|nr:glycerol-3-phosphate acyltransferase [Clostridia bacterium]
MILELLTWCVAYLMGSLPMGLYAGYLWTGQDIRNFGTGDCGIGNVLRVIGLEAALLTIALGGLKGMIPLWVAKLMGVEDWGLALGGLLILVGSLWTCYPGVKGKFSISTTLGILAVLAPATAGAALALVISGLVLFRKISWAAWALVISLPLIGLMTTRNWMLLTVIFALASLVVAKELQGVVKWPILSKDGVTYKIWD